MFHKIAWPVMSLVALITFIFMSFNMKDASTATIVLCTHNLLMSMFMTFYVYKVRKA